MLDTIVITKTDVYPDRRSVMIAAGAMFRKRYAQLSQAERSRGRRIILRLRFISPRTKEIRDAEFVLGGWPRNDLSELAIEREIQGAVVAGAI